MVETAADSWLGDSATFAWLTVDGVDAVQAGAAAVAKRENKFRICLLKSHNSYLQTSFCLPIVPRNL